MASALDRFFDSAPAATASRDLKVVASYRADVKRDSKGNAGFSIRPVLADGTEGRFGDMWIRLAEGPTTLRAFAASLPAIYAAIQKLDDFMVAEKEWPAKPAKAAAAAPAAPAAAAKAAAKAQRPAAPAAPPADPNFAPKSGDIFDDLPF
jgi:hypothetical protein